MTYLNLISFLGIFAFMFIAWLMSPNKRIINWRLIFFGTLFQLLFAIFVFWFPPGQKFFLFLNDAVVKVIDQGKAGIEFVFGPLALGPGEEKPGVIGKGVGIILATQVFPTIIFFSALMAILYYLGIMNRIIQGFAWIFTRFMRISGAESLCAASNIFVGIESSLTIRPYLTTMTRSELCVVLTAGMATIASSTLALYVSFLIKIFPTIAGHLISASILSAPAAIIMAKLILPETEKPRTLGMRVPILYEREANIFEAVINGSNAGARLIFGIVALLIAVLGLIALCDNLLIVSGGYINQWTGLDVNWSFKGLLGYLFYIPMALTGVAPNDVYETAKIVGERTVVTEVVSYLDLAQKAAETQGPDSLVPVISGRSVFITTYVLCGFAHVASMAIFVGGVSALAPERRKDLAALGFRALIAATLACLMTGAVAGALYTPEVAAILPPQR